MDAGSRERWTEWRFWDPATGKERTTWRGKQHEVRCIAFSPDGKTIASSGDSGEPGVCLWEAATGKAQGSFTGLDYGGDCVRFSSDGKHLGAAGGTVAKVWDIARGEVVAAFKRPIRGWGSVFSPDLTLLASPNYQDLDLWDVAAGKERCVLADHRGSVLQAAFTADGKTIAVPCETRFDFWDWASEVKLWDATTGKPRATAGEAGRVSSGNHPQSGRQDPRPGLVPRPRDKLRTALLDVASDRVLGTQTFKKNQPYMLAFSPDGKTLAAAFYDGSIHLWDMPPGKGK